MKVVLASNNEHKLREISQILAHCGMQVISQREAGLHLAPEETGATFEENSYIKAKAIFDACGLPTVADDSGLSVDALAGAPGVYSARFGGETCRTDRERLEHLLEVMRQVPDGERGAKFVSVITFLLPDGRRIVARGEAHGEILRSPRGENGFGYDPVFYYPPLRCSFAELSPEEKNEVSHRARALRAFTEKLTQEGYHADK